MNAPPPEAADGHPDLSPLDAWRTIRDHEMVLNFPMV